MSALRTRAQLASVQVYERASAARINLGDNTNRWGSAPSAVATLQDAARSAAAYPEPYAASLKAAVAEYLAVDSASVTTGCGSDGVLDAAIRAFGDPGDRIAIPEPTFPMPAMFARVSSVEPVPLPLDARYQPDVAAIAAARPRIVYLCSPNNPLGTTCADEVIVEIARLTDGVVIVDEAYAEFSGQSVVRLVERVPNLLVTRTMSKAFGLAALRVGYAVGPVDVVREVERCRGPYAVGAPAIAAATAALRYDLPWMTEQVERARAARARLIHALRGRGLAPLASAANFVLVPLDGAKRVAEEMHRAGVGVRAFGALPTVSPALAATGGDALRITVAPVHEMDAALDALDRAMSGATCA